SLSTGAVAFVEQVYRVGPAHAVVEDLGAEVAAAHHLIGGLRAAHSGLGKRSAGNEAVTVTGVLIGIERDVARVIEARHPWDLLVISQPHVLAGPVVAGVQ